MTEKVKRIFIGGTGRSGTTHLFRCIGSNPEIYTLPKSSESRFIIDHDGIMDLIENLTVRYDIGRPTEALRRFRALMTVYLAHEHDAPYFGKDLATWIGRDYYHKRVNVFISDLVLNTFSGSDLETHNSKSRARIVRMAYFLQDVVHGWRFGHSKSIRLPVVFPEHYTAKYFEERPILIAKCSNLIDDLFMHAARAQKKNTWCEKTPANLFHLPFIKELFPDSLFVHIVRDPRGTVASMMNVPWAPSNAKDTAVFLKELFKRWFEVRKNLNSSIDFMEIKLEEFVINPGDHLSKIYQKAGISTLQHAFPMSDVDRISDWKQKLTSTEIREINLILKDEIHECGYAI